MKYRILGKDLKVSAIGFGCMGLSHAYGKATDEREAIRVIQEAVEMGYNFFDTAQCYMSVNADGSIGYNEELVGKALKKYRDKVVIATKFGVHLEDGTVGKPIADARKSEIIKSVEASLKKLNVECIDLYYQHRVDKNISPEEVAEVMSELIKAGKISHWGISEVDEDYLRRANSVCPVTAIQNRYSMMARHYEKLFPVLEELNIGFVAFSPLANGFLSGKYNVDSKFEQGIDYRSVMPQFSPEGIKQNEALLKLLQNIAEQKNATLAQISLAWLMCKKPWIVPIPGSRKIERIKENREAINIELSLDEVKMIDIALDNIKMSAVFGVDR